MCHEHLAMDLSKVRGDGDSVFTDAGKILPELKKLVDLGARSLVEVSTIDMGRDVLALKKYARESGLNIIASTGFYLEPYHPAELAGKGVDAIAELFKKEITAGVDGTGICAGLIGEVATSRGTMTKDEKKVLIAAAVAAADIGCAVSTHCDMATLGLEHASLLKAHGMRAEKVILGHLDLTDDIDYHKKALDTGVNVAFDTIGKTAYLSDDKRADVLIRLLRQGYENQLVLSQDISRLSYLTVNGGLGYTAVLGDFIPRLAERGASEKQIHKLLVENPARILNLE